MHNYVDIALVSPVSDRTPARSIPLSVFPSFTRTHVPISTHTSSTLRNGTPAPVEIPTTTPPSQSSLLAGLTIAHHRLYSMRLADYLDIRVQSLAVRNSRVGILATADAERRCLIAILLIIGLS